VWRQARINDRPQGLNNVDWEVRRIVAIGLPEPLRQADALLLDPPRKACSLSSLRGHRG